MYPVQSHNTSFNVNFTSGIAFLEIQYLRPIQAFVDRVINHQISKLVAVYSVNLQPSKNATTFDAMVIGNSTTNDYNVNQTMVSSRFQYGKHMFYYRHEQKNCFYVSFDHKMPAVPSVKLQPVINSFTSSERVEAMLTAWLVNVTQSGFTYCVRKAFPLVEGPHNGTVNYVAVCGALEDSTTLIQSHRLTMTRNHSSHCVKHTFGNSEYLNKPYVFVTAESGRSDLPLVAWVRSSSQNYTEVCVDAVCTDTSTGDIHATINVIVRGNINPCKAFPSCPHGKECRTDHYGKPYCACSDVCPAVTGQNVCGSDNKTYTSECHMHVHNCKNNTSVTKKHDGVCVRKSSIFFLFFKDQHFG